MESLSEERIAACRLPYQELKADSSKVPIKVSRLAIARSARVKSPVGGNGGSQHFELEQGLCVAVVTKKHVLSKSISNIFSGLANRHDDNGIVPHHLRVICIETNVFFSMLNLYENLVFGVPTAVKERYGDIDRVLEVCSLLGVSARHAEHVKDKALIENWEAILSAEQSALLGIARALIANPDILCIKEPVTLLRDDRAVDVLHVLRRFVSERGVGFAEKGAVTRRVKTVLYTSLSLLALSHADEVLVISKDGFERYHPRDEAEFKELSTIMHGGGPQAERGPRISNIWSGMPI